MKDDQLPFRERVARETWAMQLNRWQSDENDDETEDSGSSEDSNSEP
jgi:hypothetical protein